MNFSINNWHVGVGLAAILFMVVLAVYVFVKLPMSKQLDKVRAWLIFIVIKAEKELGEKTGRLKLAFTYDLFVARFKWISMMISFETFSLLVDEALETMREMLETNKAVSELVNPSTKEVE